MTQASGPNLNPVDLTRPSSSGEVDPFSHLHKMSTTAGLGSGDYVAINAAAIASILLGVGSSLVLFDNLIFLLIPLLGLFAAVLAFKQISQSNGTQTGREVAIVGLLLSLGFGGFYGGKTVFGSYRNRSDQQQIVASIHKLGELTKAGNYSEAYALFDSKFKNRFSQDQFQNAWKSVQASPIVGSVESLDWNELLSFDTDPVDGSRLAAGMVKLKAKPSEPLRMNMAFRYENGAWLVDQLLPLFPSDQPAAGGNQGPSQGGNQTGSKGGGFIGPQKQ